MYRLSHIFPKLFRASLIFSGVVLLSACEMGSDPEAVNNLETGQPIAGIEMKTAYLLSDYQIFKSIPNPDQALPITVDQLASELAEYDVIFIGEMHGHIGNHLAQARIISALNQRQRKLAISLEQFERSEQMRVDDYLAGEIGELTFMHETDVWEGYEYTYRIIVEYAKDQDLPIIAANMPTPLVRCISQHGAEHLNRFNEVDRQYAASSLDLSAGAYKEKFYALISGDHVHSGGDVKSPDAQKEHLANLYAAQMARDETMATSMAAFLEDNPDHMIIHLNGYFHSESLLGTAERLSKLRPDLKIANIHPIVANDLKNIRIEADDMKKGTYILALQGLPKRLVQKKHINAYIAQQSDAHSGDPSQDCPYP